MIYLSHVAFTIHVKKEVLSWFRSDSIDYSGSSLIRSSFVNEFHWIRRCATWDISNGENVRIGVDSFIGDNGNYVLPSGIISHLVDLNMTTLNNIRRSLWAVLKGGYWIMSRDMGFTGV